MAAIEVRRRVVVTGMGVIAANGFSLERFWKSLVEGESAAVEVTRFDTTASPTHFAAEIQGFDPGLYMDWKTAKRLTLSHQYAVAAARLAIADAGIDFAALDADRCGVVEGTTLSSHATAIETELGYQKRGHRGVSPHSLASGYSGAGCGEIACELGVKGHAITVSSGSASGNDSIGYALGMIRHEEVDVMVAGGAEASLVGNVWGGLSVGRVLSRQNDSPKHAMRPFNKIKDGLLLGEGAAFLVMEELAHALGRGAKIYAEVLGHGRSCEAYHPVAPHPEGLGYYRAMQKGLRNAGVSAGEIDYINAHGTATEANDRVEALAIQRFFKGRRVAVSSTKPVTGHLMGAAGALETVVTALALHHQMIPLTLNFSEPAPGCDLDFVPGQSRPYPIRNAINLSSGFGGKNSCLVLGQFSNRLCGSISHF